MKKKTISITLIFVALAIIVVLFVLAGNKKDKNEYITALIKKDTLVQTVGEVGTVKASREIELNFSQTGRIKKVHVGVGDKVSEGDLLVELDYESLTIRKQEAEANLNIAKANLNKLLSGATASEIAVSQAGIDQARSAYESAVEELAKARTTNDENIRQAEKDLHDLTSNLATDVTNYEKSISTAETNLANIKATYKQSIDNQEKIALINIEDKLAAANTTLDKVDKLITDDDLADVLSVNDFTVLDETKRSYNRGVKKLNTAKATLALAKDDNDYIESALDDGLIALEEVFSTVSMCFKVLEESVTSVKFSETNLSSKKADIRSEQSIISSAISIIRTSDLNLSDAKLTYSIKVNEAEDSLENAEVALDNAIKAAENKLSTTKKTADQQNVAAQSRVDSAGKALDVAEAQFNQVKSPARSEDVSLAKSQIDQAEAQLDLIQEDIDNSILKAPIDGRVTDIEYEVGEQVSAKPAIKMLAENNFTLEVDVSEADIAKVKIGNKAEVTLDAFGDDLKLGAKVTFIEPAETVIQDVIYYKVALDFEKDEKYQEYSPEIKPGMTANITVTTIEKDGVLMAPSRAIVERNGDSKAGIKYLRILKDGKLEEIPIQTGIRGDEGMIELLSNVLEETVVVTYIKEE